MNSPVHPTHASAGRQSVTDAVFDRTYAAVLFDMDGTLISSVDAVVRCWDQVAQEYRIPPDRFDGSHGRTASAQLEIVMHDRSPQERAAALRRVSELEVADTVDLAVLPGAADALAALVPTRRCAIVTSSSAALARARMSAVCLDVPNVIVTADDVVNGKPSPEPFQRAAEMLGFDVTDCLVVEDSPLGISAAHAAGATAIGLTTTKTRDMTGDVVVRDLSVVRFSVSIAGIHVGLN